MRLFQAMDPMDILDRVLNREAITSIEDEAKAVRLYLDKVMEHAEAYQDEWLDDTGVRKKISAAGDNPKKLHKLSRIKVPISKFQKSGMQVVAEEIRHKLKTLGAAYKTETITIDASQRSTDMRRGIDHLLQELVVLKCQQHVWPGLKAQVILQLEQLPNVVPSYISDALVATACDLGECEARKFVHALVLDAYRKRTELIPEHCSELMENGVEEVEDKFGFLTSQGGYRQHRPPPWVGLLQPGGVSNLLHFDSTTVESGLDLAGRLRGGAADGDSLHYTNPIHQDRSEDDGGEEQEEASEGMSPEEVADVEKAVKKPLFYDKQLLDDNPLDITKKYRTIANILDDKAHKKITKGMETSALKALFDEALQDLVHCRVCLALDPEVQSKIAELKYVPEGKTTETVMPTMFKRILTKGVEQLMEGMVREQIHKMVSNAYETAQSTFQATVPGLDASALVDHAGELQDQLEEEAALAGESLNDVDEKIRQKEHDDGLEDDGIGMHPGIQELAIANSVPLGFGGEIAGSLAGDGLASLRQLREILDPQLMNRVVYQLTHVADLLKVYTKEASRSQSDWYHVEGRKAIEKANPLQAKAKKKAKKRKKKAMATRAPVEAFAMSTVEMPMPKFHRVGLHAASEALRVRIEQLDDAEQRRKLEALRQEVGLATAGAFATASELRNAFEGETLLHNIRSPMKW
eukprot:SAG31_NODE_1000_length_10456_cov_3.588394_2_plen_694_part_00